MLIVKTRKNRTYDQRVWWNCPLCYHSHCNFGTTQDMTCKNCGLKIPIIEIMLTNKITRAINHFKYEEYAKKKMEEKNGKIQTT